MSETNEPSFPADQQAPAEAAPSQAAAAPVTPTSAADNSSSEQLCEKITAALRRNDLPDVQCQIEEKGPRLVGHVKTDAERAIAFAIARTTAGTTTLTNGIDVRKQDG
ncbi:hypothetical protein K227x_30340 [Rubripirellula lacrimiformis]|uniref:BON domain-containing protein n=1 Tax=Rubripirellula lacrimiformis TaxID=1930273 RepID=A0A517NC12_9BACT|nr:hypothetical protein [Rubripirellula lacrimiformis]QDT04641.1 hypothetical protein K227x_30340 [Rubripirellula lacrimiformis]